MQIIRKHAIIKDGFLQVPMPDSLNNRQVEVNVIIDLDEPVPDYDFLPVPRATVGSSPELPVRKKANLGHLIGSWAQLTPEQKERMENQLRDLRNSWERDTF